LATGRIYFRSTSTASIFKTDSNIFLMMTWWCKSQQLKRISCDTFTLMSC
jgi:hypothetical protein